MNKLSFRNRLIIGFGIIVILTIAIAIYATNYIQQFKSNTDILYHHPLQVSNAAKDININVHIIHKTMKDISILENKDEISSKLRLVEHYEQKSIDDFALIQSQYLGDKRDIDLAYNTFIDWKPIRQEVVDNVQNDNIPAATKITTGKGAEHVNLIISQMQTIADFADNKANELFHQTSLQEQKAITNLYIILTLIIAITIALAIVLSINISRPIRSFINEIAIVFRDSEFTQEINDKAPEVYLLEATQENIKHLVSTLNHQSNQLRSFNKQLENRVQERTKELETSQESLSQKNQDYEAIVEQLQKTNQELSVAMKKAEESDNLKSAFLANLSHEIRTPLNAIVGFTQILNKKASVAPQLQRYIEIIEKSGNQLLAIVNDVLNISMIETKQLEIEKQAIDLQSFMQDILTPYQYNNKNENIKFEIGEIDKEDYTVLMDATKIQQVFNNLINNAIRFTKEGSIEIGFTKADKNLQFYVKDTGKGIDHKFINHIFDRFYQVKDKTNIQHRGTGLGLSICKGYMEAMGGDIHVESELDQGTIFYFFIPYEKSAQSATQVQWQGSMQDQLKKVHILVAEDEELNWQLIQEIFEQKDVELTHVWNGKEAVKFIQKHPSIDLILMDVKMPVMNGFEACEKIKEIDKSIPIVAQTAYALHSEVAEIKKTFDAYIAKPINTTHLINMIQKLLQKH